MKKLLLAKKRLFVVAAVGVLPLCVHAQFGGLLKDLKAAGESLAKPAQPAEKAPAVSSQLPTNEIKNTQSEQAKPSEAELATDNRLKDLYGDYKPYKNFFFDFQKSVVAGDKARVASMILYPIVVGGQRYNSSNEFSLAFDSIFTDALKKKIQAETYESLFSNDKGVMLADGAVWYTGVCADSKCATIKGVLVISINIESKPSDTAKTPNTQAPQQQKEVGFTAAQFGYLAGTIKIFDGAGCAYYRKEDEKKKNAKYLAADDYDGKGVILNIDGKDVLMAEKSRNEKVRIAANQDITLTVRYGQSKSCGEECSLTYANFELVKGSQKITLPAYAICGS